MTKRIIEAASTIRSAGPSKFRVCLVSEGESKRARLSFPNHPLDYERPEHRNPLDAIGVIGDKVTVETDPETGKLGFWADYNVSKSKAEVGGYLEEFAVNQGKLGLSIFLDSDGYDDPVDGKYVPTILDANDPYKSVDLVIAPGRGGKFQKVAESLGLLTETSATAGGKESPEMEIKDVEKVVADGLAPVVKLVEDLAAVVKGQRLAESQAEVDAAAVEEAVEQRVEKVAEAFEKIAAADLTETQAAELRAKAKAGVDIDADIETQKKVLAEARAGGGDSKGKLAEAHLGGGDTKTDVSFDIPGFGKVA